MISYIKTASSSFMRRISDTLVITSIRQGLTLMIPVMMIGAFAIFLNNLPVKLYQEFMSGIFGSGWNSFGVYVHRGTFAIMATGMLLSISYSMARNSLRGIKHEVNPMITAIVSLASLFAMMNVKQGYLLLNWLGPLGVFIAILIACTSSLLFLYFSSVPRLKIRLYSNTADRNLAQAISSLVPAMLTISVFSFLHILLASAGIEDVHAALNQGLKNMFTGMSSSLFTAVIFVGLIHLFWFFGIHGNNVLEPVTQTLFVPALEVNRRLADQGLPPVEIFTKQFFDVFVFLGGSGATLCLIVALLLGIRRSNTKQIAVISTLPGIFNVNEIMVFGIPVILNFYLFIPFVILPVILTAVTYTAMSLGLVSLTVSPVEWTTPLIIGGYAATGSLSGAILQLFNLAVGITIYWPFVRMYEKRLAEGQQVILQNLVEKVKHLDENRATILLDRMDDTGNLARLLAGDLPRDLHNGRIKLMYQPQVDPSNKMTGMEALLRWNHKEFGPIAPPVAVAIAEETPLIHELGIWIIKTACGKMKQWREEGIDDISLSINLSPYQLDDPHLPLKVAAVLDETGLAPSCIEIEITEQVSLGGLERIARLNELKNMGLRVAMDDFGMGHSSLMYLKELNLDTIKLDGELIHEVLTNPRCTEIISSIVQLAAAMDILIIAEFVNNHEQQKALERLGCRHYQGYLYSPPLEPDDLFKYYVSLKNSKS